MIQKTTAWIKEHGNEFGPIILRLGICVVFLWFGINQIVRPADYIGYLPSFLLENQNPSGMPMMMQVFSAPSYLNYLIIANGGFEVIFVILLLVGFWTRLAAFILGVHLFLITGHLGIEGGLNDTVLRDLGLSLATMAITFFGADKWCWDKRKKA